MFTEFRERGRGGREGEGRKRGMGERETSVGCLTYTPGLMIESEAF